MLSIVPGATGLILSVASGLVPSLTDSTGGGAGGASGGFGCAICGFGGGADDCVPSSLLSSTSFHTANAPAASTTMTSKRMSVRLVPDAGAGGATGGLGSGRCCGCG